VREIDKTVVTWGERLAVVARAGLQRRRLRPRWLEALAPHARQLAGRGALPSGTHQRREATALDAAAAKPAIVGEPLDEKAELGEPLAADIAQRLRALVGPGIDPLRVHRDPGADALAREHRADAVTVGADVFFRSGRFDPVAPKGFGLLAHEATHVREFLQPGAQWRRGNALGLREEEGRASRLERLTRGGAAPLALPDRSARTAPAMLPPAVVAAPALRPMAALADRDEAGPPPAADSDALRRGLYRDLLRQIRSEMERGG